MIWQILIATTIDRRTQFEVLLKELNYQIELNNLIGEVEILYDEDNKEKSIGKKRQDLLERSSAKYICYFDSDDAPYDYYVIDIYNAILNGFDSVGLIIDMTTNGDRYQKCCHSLKYPKWENNKDGFDYVRNITHFNPALRSLAIQVGFKDIRYGEDKDYSDRLTPLCKTEFFINKPIFHYRYSDKQSFKEKYGII